MFYFFSCGIFIPDPDTPKNIKRYADSACSFCPHLAPPALSKKPIPMLLLILQSPLSFGSIPLIHFILYRHRTPIPPPAILFFAPAIFGLSVLSQNNAPFRTHTHILLLLYHPPVERAPVPTILKKFLFLCGPDSDTQKI
jgi:hypothetical protein